jgi:hypothetical protein
MLATACDLLVFLGAPLLTIQCALGLANEIELFLTLGDERPTRIICSDGGT